MTTTTTDETWIEEFTVELRLRRVSGPAIGDAVASVRELLADSGESAEAAFGPAREYAASLDLPVLDSREQAIRTVLLPVLGLFTFLVFSLASMAWSAGDPVLLSVPQLLLLAIPVLLTVMFAFPFYPRAVFRQRWLPVVLVLVAGAAGALATLVAPASAAEAWLVLPASSLLVGSMAVLVLLAVIGTVATLRSADEEEIVAPLQAPEDARGRRRRSPLPLVVNWLFPILAIVIFGMNWGIGLLS